MPPKKKQKEKAAPVGINDTFAAQLEALGLGGALRLADEYDNDVVCVTTGFPGLDHAIDDRGINCGLPRSRHSELYSKKEHAGKTSLALAIAVTWQLMGLRVCIIDIEGSMTTAYLKQLGFIVDRAEAEARGLYAVYLLQVTVKVEDCETDMFYVEGVLDTVAKAANVFDMVIVDSVDAMVSEAEAAKSTSDNDQVGGISKKMRSWFRKNTVKRAHVMWLNHSNRNIGGTMISYSTSGGKSVPRYSSLRFELEVTGQLKDGEGKDPYGFITRVKLVKDRLGANWRYTDLYYIWGEGFSKEYDYFHQAVALGIIAKPSAGHFYILGEGKNMDERKKSASWHVQGEYNAYRALIGEDRAMFDGIKQLIDGEDVAPEVGVEHGDESAAAAAEAEELEAAA
jgi:recombination protein RecA